MAICELSVTCVVHYTEQEHQDGEKVVFMDTADTYMHGMMLEDDVQENMIKEAQEVLVNLPYEEERD